MLVVTPEMLILLFLAGCLYVAMNDPEHANKMLGYWKNRAAPEGYDPSEPSEEDMEQYQADAEKFRGEIEHKQLGAGD